MASCPYLPSRLTEQRPPPSGSTIQLPPRDTPLTGQMALHPGDLPATDLWTLTPFPAKFIPSSTRGVRFQDMPSHSASPTSVSSSRVAAGGKCLSRGTCVCLLFASEHNPKMGFPGGAVEKNSICQ